MERKKQLNGRKKEIMHGFTTKNRLGNLWTGRMIGVWDNDEKNGGMGGWAKNGAMDRWMMN